MNEPRAGVDPDDLVGYLASRGWHHEGTWRGAMVWERDTGRVLVPARREYADDDELLRAVVRNLARIEGRSERYVLLDITEPETDVPSFRLQPETSSGTIPLPAALKAVQGIHDVLKVAAQTVESGPRLLFVGKRSRYVDSFLSRVRLGTTRPGSYVFDARVPVHPPPSESKAVSWNDELAGREVLGTLHKALTAAHTASRNVIENQGNFGVFDDYVEEGVSANLCTALGNLGGVDRNRPFDVSFAWARAEPTTLGTASLAFTGPMVSALATASSDLEKLAKSGRATIVGEVDLLRPGQGEEPRVKIKGELQTGSNIFRRSVWVVLSLADYQRAFHAETQKRRLRITGQLIPHQKRLEMRPDPTGFEVL
ncbi:hypothetical protein [Streptosporangium sp. KLBMP 9127]|nr:hypothetical protein [Streptosporangium sp. KLBMP 9127]